MIMSERLRNLRCMRTPCNDSLFRPFQGLAGFVGFVNPGRLKPVSKLEFFTPKALHNLAQGITLGLYVYLFIPTLKALNKSQPRNCQTLSGSGPSLASFPAVPRRAKLSNAFGVSDAQTSFDTNSLALGYSISPLWGFR